MNVEIKLQYCDAPQRDAVAWLIPGNSAQAWLAELATWQVSLVAAKLLIVGRADDSQNNAGLLVIVDGEPTVSARCQRYGRVGERIYVPIEGQLWPEVPEQQLSSWLPSTKSTYVWHPTLGLLSIEPHQALSVSDLIAPLAPSTTAWDRAEPGVAPNRQLVSIRSDAPPTFDQILENGRDDIGSQADEPGSLPPHPAERSALGRAGDAILGPAIGAVHKLIGALQTGTGRPSALLEKLRHWAEHQMQRHSASLQAERNKALARLVEMLDKNPDEGLKHALPLAGEGRHRGIAPPSSQLARRDVNFRLGGRGRGPAADPWDASAYHDKLLQRYRVLANRELNLGRYRRAAYIFAELLGDLRSAAQALEQGTFYHEAAILFEQRLSSPYEAARCYEAGGLWADAITILERLCAFERVGDLYSKLNDRDRAAQAYERAIEREIGQGDYLDAARLIEYRLEDPRRAYALLVESWPMHSQAMWCMKEAFSLLARHHWHDEAARQVRELPRNQWASAVPVVEQLASIAREYPIAEVRALAADQTRSLAGKHLPTAVGANRCTLTDAVRKLVPEDRLLARDAQRYLRERSITTTKVARHDGASKQNLQIVGSHQLPPDVEWVAAGECQGTTLVFGWRRNGLVVGRINATFSAQQFGEVTSVRRRGEGKLLIAVPRHSSIKVLVHQPGDRTTCADWQFPSHPAFAKFSVAIGSHSSVSADTVGLHSTLQGLFSLEAIRLPQRQEIERLLVRQFSPSGNALLASYEINLVERTGHLALEPLLSAAADTSVFVGSGAFFLSSLGDTQVLTTQLPHPLTALQINNEGDSAALSFEHGVLVMSPKVSRHRHSLVSNWPLPVTGFLSRDELAIASEHGVVTVSFFDRRPIVLGTLERHGRRPLAVLSATQIDQFLVVYQHGRIERYQFDRRRLSFPRNGV